MIGREDTYPAEMGYPRNQWYVAAFSREVSAGETLHRVLLDVPVMLYRTEGGEVVALHDRCPHRGASLSMGKRIGDEVQCPYHGIRFGTDGRCTHIPSRQGTPAAMAVQCYAAVEKWQWIWIWLGDQDKADPALIPDHDWLCLSQSGYTASPFFMIEVGCNYQFFHDNLLDASHLSYVHRGTLDNGGLAATQYQVKQEDRFVLMSREEPEVVYDGPLAAFFRCKPGKTYHRTHTTDAFMPSIHIAKQWLRDVDSPETPGIFQSAVNALTPRDRRTTYLFNVVISNYPDNNRPEDVAGVRHIIEEDVVILEALQRDYEEHGDTRETSVAADKAGMMARRIVRRLIKEEAGA